MTTSVGNLIYWSAVVTAAIIVVLTAIEFLTGVSEGVHSIPVHPLLVAAIIWLIGRACRFFLTER
jgi:hypothetical protein